jgi:hypothetical protein
MIPETVLKALGKYEQLPKAASGPVAAGDVRILQGFDGGFERLALVLQLDRLLGTAQVTLIHPYVELATEHDLVIGAESGFASFDLVVQRDIRASVWVSQLANEVVCRFSKPLVAELMDLIAVGSMGFSVGYLGTKLRGPLDVRWDFKVSEGRALMELASNCTTAMLDGSVGIELDDLGVMTAILRAGSDFEEMLLCLHDLVREYGENLKISLETWSTLDKMGLLDLGNLKNISRKNFEETQKILYELFCRTIATPKQVTVVSGDIVETRIVRITAENLRELSLIGAGR